MIADAISKLDETTNAEENKPDEMSFASEQLKYDYSDEDPMMSVHNHLPSDVIATNPEEIEYPGRNNIFSGLDMEVEYQCSLECKPTKAKLNPQRSPVIWLLPLSAICLAGLYFYLKKRSN